MDTWISIHTLLAESDPAHNITPAKTTISIHTLLAESDIVLYTAPCPGRYFNPGQQYI